MSTEQVVEKAKKSFFRTAGWGIAFGCIGAIPSAINVSNTNEKIQADYESRMLKGGNLVAGGVTEGLICFNVPEDINNLSGWKVSVILKDIETGENIILEYGLSGTIVSPQKRISEQQEGIDEGTSQNINM